MKKKNLAEKFEYNVDEHKYKCKEQEDVYCKHFRKRYPDEILSKECFYDELDKPYGNIMVKIPKEKKSQKVQHYVCKYKEHQIITHPRRHHLGKKDKYLGRIDKLCQTLEEDALEFLLQRYNQTYKYAEDKRHHRCLLEIVRDNYDYHRIYERKFDEIDYQYLSDDGTIFKRTLGNAPEIVTVEYSTDEDSIIVRDNEELIQYIYSSDSEDVYIPEYDRNKSYLEWEYCISSSTGVNE